MAGDRPVVSKSMTAMRVMGQLSGIADANFMKPVIETDSYP
jgi:hypothetical protein